MRDTANMRMKTYNLVVVATFGLESIVKKEIIRLGYTIDKVENGSIYLQGDMETVAMLNLNLRCADRVYIMMGQFNAVTWDDLFKGVNALAWHEVLGIDSRFPVNAKSVKSTLYSLSDIQALSKKAIVNQLKQVYSVEWFQELGPVSPIHVNIHDNLVSVLVDTSGTGMHKRGYRENANEAPLKETLAAGLVQLAGWYGKRPLYDPFCGTGTILIEAAMLMRNIPPGLSRKSVYEQWTFVEPQMVKSVRKRGYEGITYDRDVPIVGTDIDARTIEIAKQNAVLAGVDDCIDFRTMDIRRWTPEHPGGIVITNPPYGERLEDAKKASDLHRLLAGRIQGAGSDRVIGDGNDGSPNSGITGCYVLTSHEGFESDFGARADKNRKLFNGNLKCYFYQYSFYKK